MARLPYLSSNSSSSVPVPMHDQIVTLTKMEGVTSVKLYTVFIGGGGVNKNTSILFDAGELRSATQGRRRRTAQGQLINSVVIGAYRILRRRPMMEKGKSRKAKLFT